MKKWVLYDRTRTMMYPSGDMANPARMEQDFPAMAVFPHVILTDESEQVCWAVQNFAAARSNAGIAADVPDEEALAMLTAAENAPREAELILTPEERIAAALEFQSLMMLDDAEEGQA